MRKSATVKDYKKAGTRVTSILLRSKILAHQYPTVTKRSKQYQLRRLGKKYYRKPISQ